MTVEAELDGLGPRLGPATTWTVPKGFGQEASAPASMPWSNPVSVTHYSVNYGPLFMLIGLIAFVAYRFLSKNGR
jgi:hypothetical protein